MKDGVLCAGSGPDAMRFAVYQISRKGGREKNEDRMGYCYTRDAGLFALADGMGGHPEGDMAAQVALEPCTMAATSVVRGVSSMPFSLA